MLPSWVLDKLLQEALAAEELSHSAIAEQLDIIPTSDNLSTLRVLQYATSGSGPPGNFTSHYHAADFATFRASYTDGRPMTGGFVRIRLNHYIDNLEGQAEGFLPPVEDIASALEDYSGLMPVFKPKRRCRHSPFAAHVSNVVALDYESLWYLWVKSPHRKSEKEDIMRLVRIRDCTPRQDCCWKCRMHNNTETSRCRCFKAATNGVLPQPSKNNRTARYTRLLETQRDADSEDMLFERWPDKETENARTTNPDRKPWLEQRLARYEQPVEPRQKPLREGFKPCVYCYLVLHKCDGLQPTCTTCLRDGYKCTYYRKGCQAIWTKPKPFRKTRSKLSKMKTLDIIETQYALGDEDVKKIPPWTRIGCWPPPSFIRNELAIEIFSPERSPRFVRPRRRQESKTSTKKGKLKGMSFLCEKCLERRWAAVPMQAAATPKKTALDPFLATKKADRRRLEESKEARRWARLSSGFRKQILGPSKLRNEIEAGDMRT